MRAPTEVEVRCRHRVAVSPLRETVSFDGDDLVLGCGTVLYKLGTVARTVSLRPDAAHDRMLALLAVAGRGRLDEAALSQLAAALEDWRRGERALAAIRLAFAPLPRLQDREDAYRLCLAKTALDAGLAPTDLLVELGYDQCAPLLKFDSNQPRVPAGSGTRSGQWTSGGTAGQTPSADESPRPTPIFFRPEDTDDHGIEEKWRRLGIGETEQERIEEGRPFRPPTLAPGLPAAPGGVNPLGARPGVPDTSGVPAPRLTSPPGGGSPPPEEDNNKDNESACPKAQTDRPHGSNVSGEEFEYGMSLLINPNNPTPKCSMATPDVTSQAYYLPSPTPDGKTSFDDCKQDDRCCPN